MWAPLYTKVHSSWLILALCASFVVGVIGAQYADPVMFSGFVWMMVAIVMAVAGFCFRSIPMVICVILAGCIGGLWRGSVEQRDLAVYQDVIGSTVVVVGSVAEDVDNNQRGQKVVRMHDASVNTHPVAGKIWVTIATKADIKRSDNITIRAKMTNGFGNFSATMYSAELLAIERPSPGDVALTVRDWFADHIRIAIPDPQAALGIGYLVGQRRALPPELDQALQIAGLTHIVVASGYNLTILVRLARRLFVKISKFASMFAASGMVVSFMAVTGMSPSMSRAGLVAGLSLLAWYYGRKFHPLILLCFAAAVTVLVNPGYAWGDLGWQLSFAAFAGVMILAPLGQAYFFGNEKPGTIRQILGETIAAQIATLPILVVAFGQFSNVAIIANALVLPLVPLAMLLTFIAGVVAVAAPSIATIAGWPAEILLTYMVETAMYLSKLPWAIQEVSIPSWVAVAMYGLIFTACVYLVHKTRYDLRDSNIVE